MGIGSSVTPPAEATFVADAILRVPHLRILDACLIAYFEEAHAHSPNPQRLQEIMDSLVRQHECQLRQLSQREQPTVVTIPTNNLPDQ